MWRFPPAPYFSQVLLVLFALFALFKDWKAYASVIPFEPRSRGRHLFPVVIACLILVLAAFSLTNIHESRVATARDRDTIESLARQINQARDENRNTATSVSDFQVQLEMVDRSQSALDDFYRSIPGLSSVRPDGVGTDIVALQNAVDTAAKHAFISRAFSFRSAQSKEQFLGSFALTFSDAPPLAIVIAPCVKAADGQCEPKIGLRTQSGVIWPSSFHVSNQNLNRSGQNAGSIILLGLGNISRNASHNVTARVNFDPLALHPLRELTGTLNLTTFGSVPSLRFVANPESFALGLKSAPPKMKTVHDGQGGVQSVADIPDDVLEAAIATVPRRVNVSFTFNLSDDLQSFYSYEREDYPTLAIDGFAFSYRLVESSGVSSNGPKVHADDALKGFYHYAPRQQSVHP